MISKISSAIVLALSLFVVSACALEDLDQADQEPQLEQLESLRVRPRHVPPGSEGMSMTMRPGDDPGTFEIKTHFCHAVGAGSECTTMLCANLKMGEDHHCEVTCGYSCDGTPDECLDVGCD